MTDEPLALNGCAPTPLASYLKALGVLRLISSPANHVSGAAADPHARGWWENERFHMRTTLSRDALLNFFLYDYAPSPIIAPWNGRAGFLEGDAGEMSKRTGAALMHALESSGCCRLNLMRNTVHALRKNKDISKYDCLRAKEKRLLLSIKEEKEAERKIALEEDLKEVVKQAKKIKSTLLLRVRSETDSHHVSYIDACYALSTDQAAAPLLGSGGNDGSRDFGVNFAEKLQTLIDFQNGNPKDCARADLESATFDVVQLNANAEPGSMGQFTPGKSGPNATTGYEGNNPLNPWDVVLALEGTLVFAGALTRRLGATGGSRGAFPFTFEHTGAGAGSLSSEDSSQPRGEIWTPIWIKPATFAEVATIFSEGRLTLNQRAARTGLDAARSVARVGVSRGISAFERYSIIQPDSKMPYQATPLGRFKTPDRPRRNLIGDLEAGNWLQCAKNLADNRTKAPARARHAMRRLEDSLFQMTAAHRASEGARNALTSLGNLVGWLATNRNARKELKPPPVISSDWVRKADDDSAEFRIAAALAGLGLPAGRLGRAAAALGDDDGDATSLMETSAAEREKPADDGRQTPPMVAHFAPVDEKSFFYREGLGKHRAWSDGDAPPTMVWNSGPLVSNMIAVLERRLVEASIRGLEDKLLASANVARLADVAAFLSGKFDDAACAALLAGLGWARPMSSGSRPDHGGGSSEPSASSEAGRVERDDAWTHSGNSSVPFAYAALKPIFTPEVELRRVGALPETARIPVPPGLVARLRVGGDSRDGRATDAAVRTALARARASGLTSPFDPARSGSRQSPPENGSMGVGVPADRLAAALLIPISELALIALLKRAWPGALSEDDTTTTEDTTNAA